MTVRQQRKAADDIEKLQALRDLRLFDLIRVAVNGDNGDAQRFRIDLIRKIDEHAGVNVIDLRG